MRLQNFRHLPDETSIWIYGFDPELTADSEERIRLRLTSFIDQWETHGQPVQGAFEIREKRFVILAGYAPGGISGCSIDASVRVFKHLRAEGLDGLDRSRIYYRSADGAVESVHYTYFQAEIDAGRVGSRSPVFDTHIARLALLRSGEFEKPLFESWHARAFSLPREKV